MIWIRPRPRYLEPSTAATGTADHRAPKRQQHLFADQPGYWRGRSRALRPQQRHQARPGTGSQRGTVRHQAIRKTPAKLGITYRRNTRRACLFRQQSVRRINTSIQRRLRQIQHHLPSSGLEEIYLQLQRRQSTLATTNINLIINNN